MESIPPIFMFGFERSGTTLLSMVVGAHPDIAVPFSVAGMWFKYYKELGDYKYLNTEQNIEKLTDDILSDERIKFWDIHISRDEVLSKITAPDYAGIVHAFHEIYAAKKEKYFWANLDIATLDSMDIVNEWFPTCKFIHLVRDGRDIALSHQTMPYGYANVLDTAENWKSRVSANVKMGKMISRNRYKILRFEDLIINPDETLEDLCRFIGVKYSEDMQNFYKMVDEKVPEEKIWLWPSLKNPFDHSKVNCWKKKMPRIKRVIFERSASHLLSRFGYEVYQRIPKSILSYFYEIFYYFGMGGRYRRVLKKFGLSRLSKLERENKRHE